MYKKILVPVDDSQASLKALNEACKIAQETQATIAMVHVIDLAQFSWGCTGYLQSGEVHNVGEEAGNRVLGAAREVVARYNNVKTEEHVLENAGEKVAHVLAKKVTEYGCDLVVMGTHGFSGVMHLLMGSVAEGVLRQVDIPVMLVRHSDN